jgi:hypothetical protein
MGVIRRPPGSDLNKELKRVHAHWALSVRGRPQTVSLEADRDDARQEAQRKAGEHVPGARLTQDTWLAGAVNGNLPGAASVAIQWAALPERVRPLVDWFTKDDYDFLEGI